MPRRYWLPIIASIGLVCSLAAHAKPAADAQPHHRGRSESKRNVYVAPIIPLTIQRDIDRIASALEGTNAYQQSANEQRDERKNLKAQQEMARAARKMFWVGIAESALTLIGIGLVGATLAATRRAAKAAEGTLREMQDSGKKELRAYITVAPAGINQLIMGDKAIGHVIVQNVGKLPARDVFVIVQMRVSENREETEFKVPRDTERTERAIQPGAEMRQGSKDNPIAREICDASKTAFVFGVVYYSDGFEGTPRRFTRFCHRYSCASYNRDHNPHIQYPVSRTIIEADKARYHIYGNTAD